MADYKDDDQETREFFEAFYSNDSPAKWILVVANSAYNVCFCAVLRKLVAAQGGRPENQRTIIVRWDCKLCQISIKDLMNNVSGSLHASVTTLLPIKYSTVYRGEFKPYAI